MPRSAARGNFRSAPWTKDTNAAGRAAWEKALDELAALHPTRVIAGHKDPTLDDAPSAIAETRAYLVDFDAGVARAKTAADVQQKITAKYGKLQLDLILQLGAEAAVPSTK